MHLADFFFVCQRIVLKKSENSFETFIDGKNGKSCLASKKWFCVRNTQQPFDTKYGCQNSDGEKISQVPIQNNVWPKIGLF